MDGSEITPRAVMSNLFEWTFAGKGADVCNMRLEAHKSVRRPALRGWLGGRLKGRVAAFTLFEHYKAKTDMSAMMRTTAFPASIVIQMLAAGLITKRDGVLQERDVPADLFLEEMAKPAIRVEYSME
ncbi:MAG: hypothetical protein WB762_17895 [Candidatus Sulfotelmatobacter sp.]